MNTESQGEISCAKCGAPLPPTVDKCNVCGTVLPREFGPTVAERQPTELVEGLDTEVPKPDPDEVPLYIRKVEIALALFVVLVGIVFNFSVIKLDRDRIIARWTSESSKALFTDQGEGYWAHTTLWPPEGPVTLVTATEPRNGFHNHVNDLVEKSGIVTEDDPFQLNLTDIADDFDDLRQEYPKAHWLLITGINSQLLLSFEISYWSPEVRSIPLFRFRKMAVPIWPPLLTFGVIVFLAWLTRFLVIERYRSKRRHAYEAFQNKRTERVFEAKAQVDSARRLAESGQIAKALVVVNDVLRAMPDFHEARELRNLLLLTQEAGTGTLTIAPQAIHQTAIAASKPTLLYLRVIGTPYAYQAPSGAELISIGRQRRKAGDSWDVGNDVVVRVPGSDEKSLRISRRHLEIHRIDADYFALDRSRGNTKHNGKALIPDKPVQLRSGDRLQVAGVITLEVLIRFKMSGHKVNNVLQVNPSAEQQDGFFIEATIGDMLTEISDG